MEFYTAAMSELLVRSLAQVLPQGERTVFLKPLLYKDIEQKIG
jgi:hypothetical protein